VVNNKPELEALINERMRSGVFQNVEDVLIQALRAVRPDKGWASNPNLPKKNLAQFLLESPLRGSGLTVERQKDYPRPVDL
jgi:hypothetical protein